MENRIGSIVCENDLDIYERNLRNIKSQEYQHKVFCANTDKSVLKGCLLSAKGKLVKVHTVSGRCQKVGLLLDVGEDFITLRLGNAPVTAVIPLNQVEYITVMHNNDRRMIDRY